jgi:hypothetical protein
MKWHSGFEKLPEDKQKVLLNIKGMQHFATYDAKFKVCRPSSVKQKYFIAQERDTYWRPVMDSNEL